MIRGEGGRGVQHEEPATPDVVFADEAQAGRGVFVAGHDDVLQQIPEHGFSGPFAATLDFQVVRDGAELTDGAVGAGQDGPCRVAVAGSGRIEFLERIDHVCEYGAPRVPIRRFAPRRGTGARHCP